MRIIFFNIILVVYILFDDSILLNYVILVNVIDKYL